MVVWVDYVLDTHLATNNQSNRRIYIRLCLHRIHDGCKGFVDLTPSTLAQIVLLPSLEIEWEYRGEAARFGNMGYALRVDHMNLPEDDMLGCFGQARASA